MFFKQIVSYKIAILIVYVVDIILTDSNLEELDKLKKILAGKF